MDKFSLYDILGILLPGLLFLFLLTGLNDIWTVIPPKYINFASNADWKDLGVLLCFGFVFGMFFYVINFELIDKKWFNKLFGMYQSVTLLFLTLGFSNSITAVLNKKSIEWFNQNIFYNRAEFDLLDDEQKNKITMLQDEYYDKAYYELEYSDKNTSPKAFQSFYFFFRQLVTVCCCLILIALVCLLWNILSILFTSTYFQSELWIDTSTYILSLGFLLLLSRYLARWNRKRMVLKLYFTYSSYLNLQTSK